MNGNKKEELPKDLRQLLPLLEQKFEDIQRKFENFFLGLEKRPPLRERDELKRLLMKFVDVKGYQYNVIYRVKQLILKFNSYNALWERMLRRLEEGEPLDRVNRMASGRGKTSQKPSQKAATANEWVEISSPQNVEEGLDELYERLRKESKSLGMKLIDRETFKRKLVPQLKEKAASSKLKLSIDLSSGKPKVKIKKEK